MTVSLQLRNGPFPVQASINSVLLSLVRSKEMIFVGTEETAFRFKYLETSLTKVSGKDALNVRFGEFVRLAAVTRLMSGTRHHPRAASSMNFSTLSVPA
jgi:hypothetical protein